MKKMMINMKKIILIISFLLITTFSFAGTCKGINTFGKHKVKIIMTYFTNVNWYEKRDEHQNEINNFLKNHTMCNIEFAVKHQGNNAFITFITYHE